MSLDSLLHYRRRARIVNREQELAEAAIIGGSCLPEPEKKLLTPVDARIPPPNQKKCSRAKKFRACGGRMLFLAFSERLAALYTKFFAPAARKVLVLGQSVRGVW